MNNPVIKDDDESLDWGPYLSSGVLFAAALVMLFMVDGLTLLGKILLVAVLLSLAGAAAMATWSPRRSIGIFNHRRLFAIGWVLFMTFSVLLLIYS